MHDLLNPLIADDFPEFIETTLRQHCWKIDNGRRLFGRDLDKLQLGNKTVLPNEFGIQCQTGTVTELLTQLAKLAGTRNVLWWWGGHHHRHIIRKGCRGDRAVASVLYCSD